MFEFVLEAVRFVSEEGWKLLSFYEFVPETGQWKHREQANCAPQSLCGLSYETGHLEYASRQVRAPESVLPQHLADAKAIVASLPETTHDLDIVDPTFNDDFDHLRWFPLPAESLADLRSGDSGGGEVSMPLHVREDDRSRKR